MPPRPPSLDAVAAKRSADDRDHVERMLDARDRMWAGHLQDLRRAVQRLHAITSKSILETVAGKVAEVKAAHDATVSAQAEEIAAAKSQMAKQAEQIGVLKTAVARHASVVEKVTRRR
jgi:hypothetical protein